MGFYLLFFCGVLGGVLGGMGMGGGTALIPLLTLVCGVPQAAAQGINLLAFLPLAIAALKVHMRSGLVEKRGLLPLVLASALSSFLCSRLAAALPSFVLKSGFGVFLLSLALIRILSRVRKNPPRQTV